MTVWKRLKGLMTKSHAKQAVILGLDGAPYTLLQRFIKEGVMPNLSQIVHEGTFSPMDTSIPDISSVAWSTFMTGVNPGKHGVYGFMDLDPRSYGLSFTNFQSVRAPTLWDVLGKAGKRSVVINIPTTYPARELNGVLVSGFVAIDLKQATYPPTMVPYLEKIGYKLDVDTTKAKVSMDAFVHELWDALTKREEALWHLLTSDSVGEEWDLFIGVITETDRLHHYLWEAIEDPAHKYHGFFKEYYRKIDQFLGRVYDRVGRHGLFMIMSDHGFCKIEKEIYLNHWLLEQGYLDYEKSPPQSHQDIAEGTRAFNMDPARIYIHLKGKYSKGAVETGKPYEKLREEIKEKLLKLTVAGKPVVQQVFYKEELYAGPYLDQAPDLVLLPHWGFDLKGSIHRPMIAGNSLLTGMHTQDDAVIFINRPITKPQKVHILDIFPTVLSHLGLEAPKELDGVTLVKA